MGWSALQRMLAALHIHPYTIPPNHTHIQTKKLCSQLPHHTNTVLQGHPCWPQGHDSWLAGPNMYSKQAGMQM